MKLADNVTGVQDGKYSPPVAPRKRSKVKAGLEYWCVTESKRKPFKAICVKVLDNSAIVRFGSDKTVVKLKNMKRVES